MLDHFSVFFVAFTALLVAASPVQQQPFLASIDDSRVDFVDPRINGGRLLDVSLQIIPISMPANEHQFTTPDLGEPLNVIISARSDPFILTETGFHYYAK